MSNPQLAELERTISAKAAELSEYVSSANIEAAMSLCGELQELFAERNRKVKILK
jgi:hypothetical protein